MDIHTHTNTGLLITQTFSITSMHNDGTNKQIIYQKTYGIPISTFNSHTRCDLNPSLHLSYYINSVEVEDLQVNPEAEFWKNHCLGREVCLQFRNFTLHEQTHLASGCPMLTAECGGTPWTSPTFWDVSPIQQSSAPAVTPIHFKVYIKFNVNLTPIISFII